MGDTPSWSIGQLLRQLVDITLLKRGPEELPASSGVLAATVAAYVVVGLVAAALLPAESGNALPLLAVSSGMLLLWTWLLLRMARRPERFLQTATALFGVQLVLSPLAMVPQAFLGPDLDLNQPPGWPILVLFALGVWALVAKARAFKAATDWTMFACVMVMLAIELLGGGLALMMYADTAPAAAG